MRQLNLAQLVRKLSPCCSSKPHLMLVIGRFFSTRHGAPLKPKNAHGKTPFMHSTNLHNDAATKLLTAQIGREQLKLMEKAKS